MREKLPQLKGEIPVPRLVMKPLRCIHLDKWSAILEIDLNDFVICEISGPGQFAQVPCGLTRAFHIHAQSVRRTSIRYSYFTILATQFVVFYRPFLLFSSGLLTTWLQCYATWPKIVDGENISGSFDSNWLKPKFTWKINHFGLNI